eukprot:6172747-Pleurochrysis_carterae.AAC.1
MRTQHRQLQPMALSMLDSSLHRQCLKGAQTTRADSVSMSFQYRYCEAEITFPCCQQLLNDAINFLRRPAHVVRCLDAARRGGCGAEEAACG